MLNWLEKYEARGREDGKKWKKWKIVQDKLTAHAALMKYFITHIVRVRLHEREVLLATTFIGHNSHGSAILCRLY